MIRYYKNDNAEVLFSISEIKANSIDGAKVKFEYIPGSIIYAFCNSHGLWKKEVN